MNLDFSDEQQALREMVRGLLSEECPLSRVRSLEDHPKGYPDDLWKKMADLGLVGIALPDEFGGAAQSMIESAILYEELGRALVPTPHFVSTVLCARAILGAGSQALKNEWLPAVCRGEAVLSPAWLEPGGGHGPKGIQLRAMPDGSAVVLSGTKLHVQYASAATRLVVLARTGDALDDVGLFLVDPLREDISMEQAKSLASDTQYQVEFRGVRIPPEDRIDVREEGWAIWHSLMLDAAILAAAQAAGGARRALELTTEYAIEREQFGRPLAAFQSISHYLADALTNVEGGSTLVYEAAWNRSQARDISLLAPMAKLFMGSCYRDVTAMCQQVWGGVGFTVEYDIQLFFRRAKQLQLSWWDEEYLKDLVAGGVIG